MNVLTLKQTPCTAQSGIEHHLFSLILSTINLIEHALEGGPSAETREVKLRKKVFKQIATVEAKMLIPPSGSDFR